MKNRNSFKPTLRETMENTAPGMHAPRSVNVTVRRPARPREYLTEREIEKLIKAAGENAGAIGTAGAQAVAVGDQDGRGVSTRSGAESYAPSDG